MQHKYAYRVSFESQELIDNAVKAINEKLFVAGLRYQLSKGEQKNERTHRELERKEAFTCQIWQISVLFTMIALFPLCLS